PSAACAVVPSDDGGVGRGGVRAPETLDGEDQPVVLVCFPGGSCTTAYFDLDVPGLDGDSMAEYFVYRGVAVAAFDHLGIGDSSAVDDIFAITPWIAAEADDVETRRLPARPRAGTLVPEIAA